MKADDLSGAKPPRSWDTTVGADGVGYLIEAVPSGTWRRRWGDDAGATDSDGIGLALGIVGAGLVAGLNLMGRLVFRFGWDLRVSHQRARWPYFRKMVLRRRFHSEREALAALPALVEELGSSVP